jgi:hypothetical protein
MKCCGPQGGGGILRYARTSLRVGGVTVRAGDLVLLDNLTSRSTGTRWPAAWPDP